jgi:hypothetical protein
MFRPTHLNLKTENGQPYLRRLFLETSYTINDKSNIPYTLRDTDHPDGYKSLYRLYMDHEDPTEFSFAETYLDGYAHWARLCECLWFKEYVERWRSELDLKLKSRAIKTVIDTAADNYSKSQFEAVKILLNPPWREKQVAKNGRGRPTKAEVQGELKSMAEEEKALQAELARVRNYAD